jgi:hypothetical protein
MASFLIATFRYAKSSSANSPIVVEDTEIPRQVRPSVADENESAPGRYREEGLGGWLRPTKIKGLLARRDKIVAFFEKGGDARLYDYLPPQRLYPNGRFGISSSLVRLRISTDVRHRAASNPEESRRGCNMAAFGRPA